MFYIGEARPLAPSDLALLAQRHGVEERALRAVIAVEAAGKAFHSSGALVCLYEPHIAYRYTSGATRDALVNAGLAYAKRGTKPYPKSSFSRIDRCARIAGEEVAALASSWGAPQMMGFNHKVCGYPSAVQMVKSFAASEANQIEAMIRFIKSNRKMFGALQAHNWETFAYHYNGPGYAKNGYHTKLAKAYAKAPATPTPTKPTITNKPATEVKEYSLIQRLVTAIVNLIAKLFRR